MPLPPLPPNDKLLTHMQGVYLGNEDLLSKVKWVQSKSCHCHLLCHSDTREGANNPMPILLHSIFNIVCKPFMLLPDGSFSEDMKLDNMRKVTITKSLAHKNAWVHL